MAISDLVRVSPRPWLLLCLWSVGGALPGACVAGRPAPHYAELQVSIAPEPVRLPIVEATDNRFLRLSTAEGVSQTKVDHMVQDNEGFMWFGTRYGLYRYDGYAFKIIPIASTASLFELSSKIARVRFGSHAINR
jgi:hypothetical protein